jgi:hypothetical protein
MFCVCHIEQNCALFNSSPIFDVYVLMYVYVCVYRYIRLYVCVYVCLCVKRFTFLIQTNPLTHCNEIMAAYCQKPTQLCALNGLQFLNAKPGGTSCYHWKFNS